MYRKSKIDFCIKNVGLFVHRSENNDLRKITLKTCGLKLYDIRKLYCQMIKLNMKITCNKHTYKALKAKLRISFAFSFYLFTIF